MNYKNSIKENLRRVLLEKRGDSHDYGCVMLMLDIPNSEWDKIQSMIDEGDVYTKEGDKSYGREDEPHITLLYGLHDDIDDDDIKDVSEKMSKTQVNLKKISIFEAGEFDVVKFDIIGDTKKALSKINKEFAKFPHTTDFPDYHPHCTISYVKKGAGKKYIKSLSENEEIKIESDRINYSKANGEIIKYKL